PGRFRGAALLRLRAWFELWRDRQILAEQSPVRDAVLRGSPPLFPRRRARESPPAARTRRLPGAAARRARRRRDRRVLRSTDVLPGHCRYARPIPLPAGARLLHVGGVVSLSIRSWVRGLCLLALAPAMAFAQAVPQAPST